MSVQTNNQIEARILEYRRSVLTKVSALSRAKTLTRLLRSLQDITNHLDKLSGLIDEQRQRGMVTDGAEEVVSHMLKIIEREFATSLGVKLFDRSDG